MTDFVADPEQISTCDSNDQTRWQAVVRRDPTADGKFYYSVRTTGVYCRPTCPARLANRKNVLFHITCQEAEEAGFRPCKRCKPTEGSLAERHALIVARACRVIEEADTVLSLNELATFVGMSRHHFHRMFKKHTGITPKNYAAVHRDRRIRDTLSRCSTITEAIYRAGFNSNGRFYESSNAVLGMTPTAYREGGKGTSIRFAIGDCQLGVILVAASEAGICAILLGDDPDALAREVQNQFPFAQWIGGDSDFEQCVSRVVGFLQMPSIGLDLPLDIRGTAFQRRVWAALRGIPVGSTASYAEIAERIGQPKSARAVARACAANILAVAIPCHRVVRTDGSVSDYRWGVERKAALLRHEQGVNSIL